METSLPSGKIFTWNDFPNKQVSRFPNAVRHNINKIDPKYPPSKVWSCEELNQGLNICIPENINTELIAANIKEVPVVTPEKILY